MIDQLDTTTQQFIDAVTTQGVELQTHAKVLFEYLVTIQLTLSGMWMMLMGESFIKSLCEFIKLALLFAIFYAGIELGGQWIAVLINGFIQLGQHTSIQSIDPSSLFSQGLSISGTLMKAIGGWGVLKAPFVSMVAVVLSVGIIIMYALIAGELAIVLIKAYMMVSLSSVFFAFGGSDWTRAMATNYLKAVIGLGLQLMTLYFIVGVGQRLGDQWAATIQQSTHTHAMLPMLAIFGTVIVFYLLTKNIPPFVAGLSGIGGFRNYGDTAIAMGINAGMNAAKLMNPAGTMITKAGEMTGHLINSIKNRGSGASFNASSVGSASSGMHSETLAAIKHAATSHKPGG